MTALRETQKKYCSRAIIFSILIGFGIILLGQRSIGRGLILGTLFSILNFILIGESLSSRIGQNRFHQLFLSPGSIFFRYLILSVPIFLAIKLNSFHIVSTVAGIFMVQFMLLADHVTSYLGLRKTSGIG